MIKTELAFEQSTVEVEIYGKKYKAVVQKDEPMWDPTNERLKA
jgi:dimethylglycine dehydrogenase